VAAELTDYTSLLPQWMHRRDSLHPTVKAVVIQAFRSLKDVQDPLRTSIFLSLPIDLKSNLHKPFRARQATVLSPLKRLATRGFLFNARRKFRLD
jgi:hypothetical protein